MRVIIAAAGTAGHINPGLSIANKIMKEQPDSKIIFIGTDRGLETDLVPRAGYELKSIDAYGLTPKNITKIFKILNGFKQAKKIIQEFKPDIVIGTGGYICGAVITEANKLGIPTLLHESNAFPGRAVKMLTKRIENTKNVVVTGTPTKINKINLDVEQKNKIIQNIGLDINKPILLVFGGSQGAKAINDAIINLVKNKKINKYQMIWAPGPKQYDIIKNQLENDSIDIENIKNVKVYPYIYNMEEMMNVSDLLICRSGAITVTEVAKVGKAAIFIPLPGVSQNHQEYNARALEKIGAAKIILNSDLENIDLNNYIEEIILNEKTIKSMEENALTLSIKNVDDKIYEEIKKIV